MRAAHPVEVHHRIPRCLLGFWDRGHGPGLGADEHCSPKETRTQAELDHQHARHEVERLCLLARLVAAPVPGPGRA